MNKSLASPAPTINSWLRTAAIKLKEAGINSFRLDAELILGHTLKQPRTYLHAHGNRILQPSDYKKAEEYLQLRLERLPLTYITGHKEFYGRNFRVTADTLIPRPESETLIKILLDIVQQIKDKTVFNFVDVGTGCGCLGISAKLEHPALNVTLLDISPKALKVAAYNAKLLNARVEIKKSDLLSNYSKLPDIIMANLPYLDKSWQRSPETNYEPRLALLADHQGMATINNLIDQAAHHLSAGGSLILEADPRQHQPLTKYAKQHGFELIKKMGFCLAVRKS